MTTPTDTTCTIKPADDNRPKHERIRTGLSKHALQKAFNDNLFYIQGRFREVATRNDLYMAAAFTVRDRLLERWLKSARTFKEHNSRTVAYLSAEFLIGPQLANNMLNLGITDTARAAGDELNLDFDELIETEEEPGLGNGGLGRLAACFMDSLATLQIPTIGYGIRYEFGIFDQMIVDGWQVEKGDTWLRNGNPWEIPRPKIVFPVGFGGRVEQYRDDHGEMRRRWVPDLVVNGVAYDTPIMGYGVGNVNLLRLWKSEAPESFDFQAFNVGNYYGAVHAKIEAETISKVLYPNDEPGVGKELRLKQQFFFVSCSLQDMIRLQLGIAGSLDQFHEKFAIQLNDTHPSLAIAELMRLLMDEYRMPWEQAWHITQQSCHFTNHTLLPEALETWPIDLFERLLPRHLEIIYGINQRFLDEVRIHFFADETRVRCMSLIDEDGGRRLRMAHLAAVGSCAINGVAELHSNLLKTTVMRDFNDLWPERFHNITNGVTPRRFMVVANPRLTRLITKTIGHDRWIRELETLRALEDYADDAALQEVWRDIKTANKRDLSNWLGQQTGCLADPESLFDVQAKRIHEYKRQHLNILHIISLYQRLKNDPHADITPRTFIFGGKAAPGYFLAKLMIKLINAVGEVINHDPQVNGHLRVLFMPDFSVKNGQRLYPAADLSEQISLAGKEASGTGNMKFSMNGALTIGTLDGANVEIREEVGADNFFLFGMTAEEVQQRQAAGYDPRALYNGDIEIKSIIDLIHSGLFSHGDTELFQPLTDNLIYHDPFMVLADFRAYVDCQKTVDQAFRNPASWNRMAILNVARIGKFSSDRAIKEYCERIWNIAPAPIPL
ncbi:glycogen/starch/alpha-glucan phosphorylase [Rhodoferax sp. 4810]|uniref:Alpha-1,4 glucan phosphorylase n=1 Tax=Thiospirillum jenense TaxID=1653858 RepID=A0A839HD02_9GAMM|nr:glycogen/starch/alpha-glucan phosphorylase [Thiospirillum jenense]MBB1074212.1 glycogen/starch/alpha-glucan phosphorylase [Rhodoferax jenense]MBB1125286.1 glycogen/starch/alpha-glucan phosphorylase [Thiospirillum jenense]